MVDQPQIAFVNQNSYSIIGPYESLCGLFVHFPMPEVACPVVDTSVLPRVSVAEICREHVTPAGVGDVAALIEALVKAGASVGDYQTLVVEAGLNNQSAIPVEMPEAGASRPEAEILNELGYEQQISNQG